MITATFDHIERYFSLSDDLRMGLLYLKTVTTDVRAGIYGISDNIKLIVESYPTREASTVLFEAHNRTIDIQYPIEGIERVRWAPRSNGIPEGQYNVSDDRGIYRITQGSHDVLIGNGTFAVFFPEDAHQPQLAAAEIVNIKKLTIKISL